MLCINMSMTWSLFISTHACVDRIYNIVTQNKESKYFRTNKSKSSHFFILDPNKINILFCSLVSRYFSCFFYREDLMSASSLSDINWPRSGFYINESSHFYFFDLTFNFVFTILSTFWSSVLNLLPSPTSMVVNLFRMKLVFKRLEFDQTAWTTRRRCRHVNNQYLIFNSPTIFVTIIWLCYINKSF